MRDPGTPRRNPFFEYADPDEAPLGASAGPADGYGTGGLLGALGGLVEALVDAQPEASEHLVAAAHELVLAVKTVVDVTEATLAQQRAAMAAARMSGLADEADAEVHDPFASSSAPSSARSSAPPVGLRRVDFA